LGYSKVVVNKQAHKKNRLYALLVSLAVIDLVFQKNVSDPINPVKLWTMGLLASWAVANLLTGPDLSNLMNKSKPVKIYCCLLGALMLALLINFLVMPVKSIGLFGDAGRNLGFFYYLFLALVGVYTVSKVTIESIKDFYWLIFGLTFVLSIYGFLQHNNIDFVDWVTSYNPICLFTGNPDYAASLLGFFGVVSFAGIFLDFPKLVKIFLGAVVICDAVVIHFSQAFQGLAVLAIGIGIILLTVAFQRGKKLALGLLAIEVFIGLISFLGMIKIGPLGNYLYKASVIDRGYDWRAAVAMFKSHPWLGVGIDHYNGYFLQYRSPQYPLIYGYFQSGNNAHNVFLQFFATTGVFAGVIYSLIFLFISYRGYVALRMRSGVQQIMVAGIVAAWIGFFAQQVISIDFAAISLWGWVFGAVLVKLSVESPDDVGATSLFKNSNQGRSKARATLPKNSFSRPFTFGIAVVALIFVIVPMHRNNSQPFEFSQTPIPNIQGGREAYLNVANRVFNLPLLNPNYKVQVATDLAKHGFGNESIQLLKRSIASDSRNSNAYAVLADVYEHLKDLPSAIVYRKHLALFDPYGAENLLALENDYLLTGDKISAIATRDSILAMAPGTDVAKRAARLIAK